jgi:TPP-dependent trihydroxycyclohexane-1,2-dione (THcHDO) dehydratase
VDGILQVAADELKFETAKANTKTDLSVAIVAAIKTAKALLIVIGPCVAYVRVECVIQEFVENTGIPFVLIHMAAGVVCYSNLLNASSAQPVALK